jgi:Mlc titration factor MtfA (ptsG expression regulator)
MDFDLELLGLERALHEARHRLAWVRRLVADATVLKVAEDLCVEATAAMEAYRATHPAAVSSKAAATLARRR